MKVVLCYYEKGTNYGDAVIFDTARRLLERIFDEKGHPRPHWEYLNLGNHPDESVKTVHSFWQRRVLLFLKGRFPLAHARVVWRWAEKGRRFMSAEGAKLVGADLVVFVGGGLVKFRRQGIYAYVNLITGWAERNRVPVLFNAVGVEGFDPSDERCLLLKHALNRRCVKMVTTRDDLETLTRDYIDRKNVFCARVCDPAFWAGDVYGVRRDVVPGLVGLNVARSDLFGEYRGRVPEDDLVRVYADLVVRLGSAGRTVELFTNGGARDAAFGEKVRSAAAVSGVGELALFTPSSPAELVRRLAGYERYLAVRLHAAIIGTSLGVPNASLVWNDKQLLFGKAVGLEKNFLTCERLTADAVYGALMAAEGWRTDAAYRDSVRLTLEEGLRRTGLIGKESER